MIRSQMGTDLVLDTNVLVSDWMLTTAAGKATIGAAELGEIRLMVPELVLREAKRKYREALAEGFEELNRADGRLRRLPVGVSELLNDPPSLDPDVFADLYAEELSERLTAANAMLLPLPGTSHDEVLDRAFLGKRPFDSKGRDGYRDTLIWLSILKAAQGSSSMVIVTNDGHFAENGQLHSDLVEDLERFAPGLSERVSLFPSLRLAIPSVFPEAAGIVFEFNDRLRRDDGFFRRVRDAIDSSWPASAPDLDIDPSIEYEWLDYELDLVNDIFDDFEAVVAAEGEKGTTFLEITAHADIQVLYTLPLWSAVDSRGHLPDEVEPRGEDRAEFVDVVPARVTVNARYTSGADSISDVQISAITEDWEWVEDGRSLGGSPPDRR